MVDDMAVGDDESAERVEHHAGAEAVRTVEAPRSGLGGGDGDARGSEVLRSHRSIASIPQPRRARTRVPQPALTKAQRKAALFRGATVRNLQRGRPLDQRGAAGPPSLSPGLCAGPRSFRTWPRVNGQPRRTSPPGLISRRLRGSQRRASGSWAPTPADWREQPLLIQLPTAAIRGPRAISATLGKNHREAPITIFL
jgi:hypothetical protein